jgi:hypothetical protein
MKMLVAVVAVLALGTGAAIAQLALPGAAPTDSSAAPSEEAPTPAKPHRSLRRAPKPVPLAIDDAAAFGKELRLNGRSGDLQIVRADDKSVHVTKFSMLGEVISNPSQMCRIDIVADTPIDAASKGAPDGLERYSADIPACPLTFDVVDGAVIVPAQNTACVFTAADCQASPSGVWGPELPELEKDPKAITKDRAAADRSIQDSLRVLEGHDQDAAASLAREESDFAAERDDVCRSYAGEGRLGFCASRLGEARAALLAKRAADAGPVSEKTPKPHRRKKKAE